jgi:NAD(P)-dependent dehydrogenase (short-subunit alcohol dehydrogenase family)
MSALRTLTERKLDARFVRMDVSQIASIQNAFRSLVQEVEKLDVLINNAGISLDESESVLTVSPDIVFETLNTNAFSALFVTQAALPLLKSGSRVINISSGAGQMSRGMTMYAPVYSISKAAMNAITCQLAFALRTRVIAVNAVNPGWVKTEMGGSMAPRTVEKGAETPVWLATDAPIEQSGFFWHDKKIIPW